MGTNSYALRHLTISIILIAITVFILIIFNKEDNKGSNYNLPVSVKIECRDGYQYKAESYRDNGITYYSKNYTAIYDEEGNPKKCN